MAIIMTAMEIITTLNNIINSHDFFVGLYSGSISSFPVTLLFWWSTTRLLSPRIRISEDIALEIVDEEKERKDSNGLVIRDSNGKPIMTPYKTYVYRIKLANNSLRKAFDIRVFFRLRYNNHYATIELPYQPYLMSRKSFFKRWRNKLKGLKESFDNHRTIPFRLTDIRISKIEGYNEPVLQKKHRDGILFLDDFKKEDTIVEFVVMAVDSVSGSAIRVLMKKFSQKDLEEHVKEGKFLDGEMVVRTKIQTSDG